MLALSRTAASLQAYRLYCPRAIHTFTYEAGSWSAWRNDACGYPDGCWLAKVWISAPAISFGQWLGTTDHFFTPQAAESAIVGTQLIMDASYTEVTVYAYVGDGCPNNWCNDNRGGPVAFSVGTISGVDGGVNEDILNLPEVSPNPFSGSTAIKYNLARASRTSLRVFDMRGTCVLVLAQGYQQSGPQFVEWDGTDSDGSRVSPGIYFIRLQAGDRATTQKVVLAR